MALALALLVSMGECKYPKIPASICWHAVVIARHAKSLVGVKNGVGIWSSQIPMMT